MLISVVLLTRISERVVPEVVSKLRDTMSLVNDDASKLAGLSQPGQLREELLALGYFLWLRQVSDEPVKVV